MAMAALLLDEPEPPAADEVVAGLLDPAPPKEPNPVDVAAAAPLVEEEVEEVTLMRVGF